MCKGIWKVVKDHRERAFSVGQCGQSINVVNGKQLNGAHLEIEQWGKAGQKGVKDYRFLIRKSSDPKDRTFIIPFNKIVMG